MQTVVRFLMTEIAMFSELLDFFVTHSPKKSAAEKEALERVDE